MKSNLPDADWKFIVSDEELWPCLVYEYARNATWLHEPLKAEIKCYRNQPRRDNPKIPPPEPQNLPSVTKLKPEFSRMIKGGWKFKEYKEHIEYFPEISWARLPAIVRKNMKALFDYGEHLLDLEGLDTSLESHEASSSEILKLMELLMRTEEEEKIAAAQEGVPPNKFPTPPPGMTVGLANIAPFMIAREKDKSGYLAEVMRLHESGKATPEGFMPALLGIDWNRDDDELAGLFRKLLVPLRPLSHKHRAGYNRSDAQIEVRVGKKTMKVSPRRALDALGILRLKRDREWEEVYRMKHPGGALSLHTKGKGGKDGWRDSTRRIREERRLADSLLEKWFPHAVAKTG